ncbi:MAG: GLUG motif-containing protein, partial [Clostridia bacterium]
MNKIKLTTKLIIMICTLFIGSFFGMYSFTQKDMLNNGNAIVAYAWSGSGTSGNPYLISSKTDLIALRTAVNSGTTYSGYYFKMTADISLTGEEWMPIGNIDSCPFEGNFNGNRYTISYLTISEDSDSDYCLGLFGYVNNATISNFALTSMEIYIRDYNFADYWGAVAGRISNTTISNISVAGTMRSDYMYASGKYMGGLIGYANNDSIIKACYNTSSVYTNYWNGDYPVGGIVGYTDGTIEACYNTGAISGRGSSSSVNNMIVGGIVGYLEGASASHGTIEKCHNTGTIYAGCGIYPGSDNSYAGG